MRAGTSWAEPLRERAFENGSGLRRALFSQGVDFFARITWPTMMWATLRAVMSYSATNCSGCGHAKIFWESGPHVLFRCNEVEPAREWLKQHAREDETQRIATSMQWPRSGKYLDVIFEFLGTAIKVVEVVCLDALHRRIEIARGASRSIH